jgi:hypothetical protein
MPVVRVELPRSREEVRALVATYTHGERDVHAEEQAIAETWARGRTPTGVVTFVGASHNRPYGVLFDVGVSAT